MTRRVDAGWHLVDPTPPPRAVAPIPDPPALSGRSEGVETLLVATLATGSPSISVADPLTIRSFAAAVADLTDEERTHLVRHVQRVGIDFPTPAKLRRMAFDLYGLLAPSFEDAIRQAIDFCGDLYDAEAEGRQFVTRVHPAVVEFAGYLVDLFDAEQYVFGVAGCLSDNFGEIARFHRKAWDGIASKHDRADLGDDRGFRTALERRMTGTLVDRLVVTGDAVMAEDVF